MKKDYYVILGNKMKAIVIAISLIVLLLIYQYIPLIIFPFLRNSINSWNRLARVIYLFIMNIMFMAFLIYIYRKDLKKDFKDLKKNFFKILLTAIQYWIIGIVFMMISNMIISLFNNSGISENEKSIRELMGKAPLFMLFQVSIYAPLTEELIFRKSIRDAIKNKFVYVLMSGLIFGGMHVLNMDTVKLVDLLYIIPYGSLGFFFAALYNKTDNIYSSMLVHSIHNTITFILIIISKSVL